MGTIQIITMIVNGLAIAVCISVFVKLRANEKELKRLAARRERRSRAFELLVKILPLAEAAAIEDNKKELIQEVHKFLIENH